MKQFLDHFASLPSLDSGEIIALGALLTIVVIVLGVGLAALCMFGQSISEMFNTIAKHKGRREQDNG